MLPIDFIGCNIIFYWYGQCFVQCVNAVKLLVIAIQFFGSVNMLVVHTMLLGSLQWTILTQVKLALSTGKIFAVHLKGKDPPFPCAHQFEGV